jgi:phosphoglycolate phosphatase-like HAD superfamily hydrolase
MLADASTTSDDVETSKPDPVLLRVALRKVDGTLGVVVGDSTWDCVAATTLGLPPLTVRTGGYSDSELIASGATRVFDSVRDLHRDIDTTALEQLTT